MADKKISDLTPAGAITGSELVELVQGGASVRATVAGIKNGAVKVYRALLTQITTGAPTAVILENSIGTIVWSRTAPGQYVGTLSGAFPADKTHVLSGTPPEFGDGSSPTFMFAYRNDANTVLVRSDTADFTLPGANYDDNILTSTSIEILVYP